MSGYGYGHCHGFGDGSGYGLGCGDGYGDGYGSGFGDGDGCGDGYGDSYADGSGAGYGYGICVGSVPWYAPIVHWPGYLRIGCQVHSLEHWREHWQEIAAAEGVIVSEDAAEEILAAAEAVTMDLIEVAWEAS